MKSEYLLRHLPRNLGTSFGAVTPHDYSEISSRSLPRANGSGSPGPAGNPTGPIFLPSATRSKNRAHSYKI